MIARQLARRLVERLAAEPAFELRPVFLVSIPEDSAQAGYVIIGSTPDPELAAGYGASLSCSHSLVGTLHRTEDGHRLELALVEVSSRRTLHTDRIASAAGELHRLEGSVARWLGSVLGAELADPGAPVAAGEPAYRALLEGMDAELSATLLTTGDPGGARAATRDALDHYTRAVELDPGCTAAEERLLVMGAESLDGDDPQPHEAALASLAGARPRSWKAHYLLGELRRALGDPAGAIVALEHAHALHPLPARELIGLARLYFDADAVASAAAHLRRVRRTLELADDPDTRLALAEALIRAGRPDDALAELERVVTAAPPGGVAARARRLRLGLRRPQLERELERAGTAALEPAAASLDLAAASFRNVQAADPDLWEAAFGLGLVQRRGGDAAEAERSFRRALALWPDQPDALHELGVALLSTGSADEAARTLDRAAALRPGDGGYLADAGYAHLRAGDLAAARDRLARAATLDPEDPLTRGYQVELERIEAALGGSAPGPARG